MNLPLPRPERSRPAWQVLRALNELSGPDWSWRGQPENITQIARVETPKVLGLVDGLADEGFFTFNKKRDRLIDATHISITWMATPRAELRALLALVQDGQRPDWCATPCAAPGLGRARCELEIGHTGHHVDGGHPALRRGEILRWDSRGSLC